MVQLIIDGKTVHLSSETSFEFYDRNPLFSKEGKHTLDLDIDLSDPQNAFVYSSIHRIDVSAHPTGRAAVLYSERGIIIRGTEVILEINERVAKIQLVAGNSELNYLSGGDTKMIDLDLGGIETLNATIATQSLSGSYPDWDYVCTPVCVKAVYPNDCMPFLSLNSVIFNQMIVNEDCSVTYVDGTTFCPQPYLASMVDKVIAALGYTIGENFIADNAVLNKIILINGYCSVEYNEMVPNWDVNTFISEVEKFTGCIFVVNQITKVVDIIQANYFYENMSEESISTDDIIGDIDKKYDEEPPEGVLYHNVSYKFPKTEIYNYWSLDPELMDSLSVVQCDDSSPESNRHYNYLYDIWSEMTDGDVESSGTSAPESVVERYNVVECFLDNGADFGFPFVLRTVEDYNTHLRQINRYGPRVDADSDDTMELAIVPVEIVWSRPEVPATASDEFWQMPLPLARNSNYKDSEVSEEDDLGLNEYIAGEEDEVNESDNMFVAFYLGFKDCNFPTLGVDATASYMTPIASPSHTLERFRGTWNNRVYDYWLRQEMVYWGAALYDMSINSENGMYNQFWQNSLNVDFTQPYVIRFRNTAVRDSRNIFIIANQKFYCAELKYGINGDRLSDVVEGTFYRAAEEEESSAQEYTLQVITKKLANLATIQADKRLTHPISVTLRGTVNGVTRSAVISMAAGTIQMSSVISWLSGYETLVAVVTQEESDPNTYSLTYSELSGDYIEISMIVQSTTYLKFEFSQALNYDIILLVERTDTSDPSAISFIEHISAAAGSTSLLYDTGVDLSTYAIAQPVVEKTSIADNDSYGVVELPYDAEIEYLEASGTQYIDTGFTPDSNTSLEAGLYWESAKNTHTFGSGVSSSSKNIELYSGSGGFYYVHFNAESYLIDDNSTRVNALTEQWVKFVQDTNKCYLYSNDTIVGSRTMTESTFTCPYSFTLFALHRSSVRLQSTTQRISYFKIWDNGTLVRDFIPVRVGTVGYLYDRVSGQLYGNSGTGDFTLGPDV